MERAINQSDRLREGPLSAREVLDSDSASYTAAELEFLQTVQRLKKRYPHPTWNQVFHAFLGLGYRKPEVPA